MRDSISYFIPILVGVVLITMSIHSKSSHNVGDNNMDIDSMNIIETTPGGSGIKSIYMHLYKFSATY